jgi:ABC-type tungstate transport system permease subunit
VIELNPKTLAAARLTLAHPLWFWLSTDPGQRAIDAYRLGGEELFHPSAANPK